MDRIFLIISVIGIVYIAYVSFMAVGTKNDKDLILKQINLMAIQKRFESEKLQKLLDNAGLQLSSRNINIFRYVAAVGYIGIQVVNDFIRNESFSYIDLLIGLIIILFTSPSKYLPFGRVLHILHRNNIFRKDGELISFLRLYENNRLRHRGTIEFGTFCSQIASHFEFLSKDLYTLSERCVDEGNEKAIIWFCNNFPDNHHFISDIRSILLATEGMNDDAEASQYLGTQSKIILKISSDQYKRKWIRFGEYSTIITALPSLAAFLMVVVLAMQYIMLIKGNFNGVNQFQ